MAKRAKITIWADVHHECFAVAGSGNLESSMFSMKSYWGCKLKLSNSNQLQPHLENFPLATIGFFLLVIRFPCLEHSAETSFWNLFFQFYKGRQMDLQKKNMLIYAITPVCALLQRNQTNKITMSKRTTFIRMT